MPVRERDYLKVIFLSRRYLRQIYSDGVPENSGGVPVRKSGGIKSPVLQNLTHHVPEGTVADIYIYIYIYILLDKRNIPLDRQHIRLHWHDILLHRRNILLPRR